MKSGQLKTWVFLTALAMLAAGQVLIFKESYQSGLSLTVVGMLAVLVVWVLPAGFFLSIAAALKPAPPAPAAPATLPAARQAREAWVPPVPRMSLKEAWGRWQPLSSDSVVMNRAALMGLALVGEILSAGFLMGGKMLAAVVLCLVSMIPAAVYLQEPGKALVWGRLNDKFKTLSLFAAGFIPQFFSVKMLWDYKYVMTGTLITAASVAWQLWVLSSYKPAPDEAGREAVLQPHRQSWLAKPFLAVIAFTGLVLCRYVIFRHHYDMAVYGNILFAGLLVLSFPWFPRSLAETTWLPLPVRAMLGVLLVGTGFLFGYQGQLKLTSGDIEQGLWMFLAGGVCFILGLPGQKPGLAGDAIPAQEAPPQSWEKRLELFCVVSLVLIGFSFRLWHLNIFPWAAEGDEAGGGLWALDALNGRGENALISGNVPLHFFSVTGLFYKLFDINMFSLRLHSAVFGTLSLATMYFFCRMFWGRLAAFTGTLLMTFAYWHLHFSRFGFYNIEQLCLQMAAFYFFFKSEKTGKFWMGVVGGCAFGLAMMPALASRVLPFPFILYFAYLCLYHREMWGKRILQYSAFVLAAWMVLAPCLVYWTRVISLSMGRVASVSIFDRTNTNAPADTTAGFVANTKNSFLMFNVSGDTRNRNNPVAPGKELETWTAILFVLCFLYVLYHWRQPVHLFLIASFLANLATSIFSVESPQAQRSSANIPLIFSMIAATVFAFRLDLDGLTRRGGRALFALILIPAAVFFSVKSARIYFVDFKNQAFDVVPTIISQEAGRRSGKNYVASFWAEGFVNSHPPCQLFRKDTPLNSYSDLNQALPFHTDLDKNQFVVLADRYQLNAPYLRLLYPGAKEQSIDDIRFKNKLGVMFDIPAAEIRKVSGCEATAWSGPGESGSQVSLGASAVTFPGKQGAAAAAACVSWKGSLWVPAYADWKVYGPTRGASRVWIDGKQVSDSSGGRVDAPVHRLAQGLHALKVVYDLPQGREDFALVWEGKPIHYNTFFNLNAPLKGAVPATSFLRWTEVRGLLGKARASADFSGDPVIEVIQPQLIFHHLDPPLNGTWTEVWNGKLLVDRAGVHDFRVVSSYFGDIQVDGKVVARAGSPLIPELADKPVHGRPMLSQGWHDITVHFASRGGMALDCLWTPPGKAEETLPADHLKPY